MGSLNPPFHSCSECYRLIVLAVCMCVRACGVCLFAGVLYCTIAEKRALDAHMTGARTATAVYTLRKNAHVLVHVCVYVSITAQIVSVMPISREATEQQCVVVSLHCNPWVVKV